MSTDSPRVSVVMPTAHEATRRIAKVLADEGVLGEFLVAFDSWKLDGWLARFGPPASSLRRGLRQWRQEPRGTSGALLQELACSAAFRFLGGHPGAPDPERLVRWRVRTMDRSFRRLTRQCPGPLVVLQDFHHDAVRGAAQRRVPLWEIANSDVWGVHAALSRLAERCDPGPWRDEILRVPTSDAVARSSAALGLASVVITESPRMSRTVTPFLKPGAEVVEVGQGVDTRFFAPIGRESGDRPLRVVTVSRIAHGKGLSAANEIPPLAGKSISEFRVVGWDAARAPLLARSLPNLELLGGGPREKVLATLARADVMVLPTLGDSMPRAVLEAMACGLPVITTFESGYDHLIRHGENGFLVSAHDPEAIAALLKTLADDGELRARVGRAARATAEDNTWEHLEERFRRAFRERLLPLLTSKTLAGADEQPPA
jgi:glycosyltransferase involved in cell wall biosynthesis